MKKIILTSILGSTFLFNYCFASTYGNETGQDIQNKYGWHLDDFSKNDEKTSHHVHQSAPIRPGFENPEKPTRSTSQTFGDTTYHTYYPPEPRKGFSN